MLKRTTAILFIALIMISVFPASLAASARGGDEYARVPISLAGEDIGEMSGMLIDSITYAPLRALAESVHPTCRISYDSASRTATVTYGEHTVTVTTGKTYISVDGRYFYGIGEVKNIDGSLYAPIRPIARALGLEVEWDAESRSVALARSRTPIATHESFYRSDEIYWLSRIIEAEAGGEPFKGKIAVGNVVLNRMRSPEYPSTIYGVIFDFRYGTQFTPAYTGTIYNTPSKDSIIAAKICLEGYDVSDGALFFFNPRIATSFWISSTRKYAFSIGDHDFYY